MKKLLVFLCLAFAMVCSAQSITPEFQAFSGALLKLKKADKGFHKFQLTVDVAPWAFQATGEVQAPGGDPDLLITALFDGELYAVLAYVPSAASGSDGKEYQVGFFDIMLYYEEEPTRIRNLKFKLLPPADDDWAKGILKDALESGSLLGNVWGGKYDRAITRASANPMDKKKLLALQGGKKKKLSDDDGTISKKKRRVEADEEEEEEEEVVKPKKKKKVVEDEEEDDPPKKKKSKKKKKIVNDDDDEDPCEDPSLSAKEKRRCRMSH